MRAQSVLYFLPSVRIIHAIFGIYCNSCCVMFDSFIVIFCRECLVTEAENNGKKLFYVGNGINVRSYAVIFVDDR